jgi:hypothetical protein
MPRPATGSIRERPTSSGDVTFEIRFAAYSRRESLRLGRKSEGWTRQRAEDELLNIQADVRRGVWQPAKPEPVEAPAEVPDFHTFASEWLAAREPELRPKTITDYKWSLELHLLPFFKDHRLTEIGVEDVDRYRATKLREGKLAPNAVTKDDHPLGAGVGDGARVRTH